MVLDAAKGIEEQSEVCPLRDVPIITFVNKLDREGRDPFDLLNEIEQPLALDATPASGRSAWGATFSAPTNSSPMRSYRSSAASTTGHRAGTLPRPRRPEIAAAPAEARTRLIARGGRDGAKGLFPPFDPEAYRAGYLTPVYFGAGLTSLPKPDWPAFWRAPQLRGWEPADKIRTAHIAAPKSYARLQGDCLRCD